MVNWMPSRNAYADEASTARNDSHPPRFPRTRRLAPSDIRRGALRRCLMALLVAFGSSATALANEPAAAKVDFASDVYPILRKACLECHGAERQLGDLRLDSAEQAFSSGYVIVEGKPEESELIRRVELPAGHKELMPAVGEPLKARDVTILKRWIAAGALWPEKLELAKHWSYVAPVRPPLPTNQNDRWRRNPVDAFILQGLEQAGLKPSPEAERAVLLRRLSLDLIGLPPTPEEIAAFVADPSEAAYLRTVDELLSRPQFGERWARPWLDLARYADSHGFQRDDLREAWAYRDWVIHALNADMPFDQFSIEQLAGDLLPGATEAQKIATGFHRCTPSNVEAGSEPEETRINQVIDRVNTTGAVWLGATLECAQCHDHKFDPFSQKDYYRLLAFYNNTEIEAERTNPKVPGSIQFIGPKMPLADPALAKQRRELQTELTDVKKQLAARRGVLTDDLDAWAGQLQKSPSEPAQTHVLQVAEFASEQGCESAVLEDGSVLVKGPVVDKDTYQLTVETKLTGIRAIRLETLTHESLPGQGPGRGDAQRPNFVLHAFAMEAAPASEPQAKFQPVSFKGASASFSQARFDVSGAIDASLETAWAINPKFGQPHWASFATEQPVGFAGGTRLSFRLVQNYGGGRTIGRFRLLAETGQASPRDLPAEISNVLAREAKTWKPADRKLLVDHRVAQDAESTRLLKSQAALEKEQKALAPPTTLVMQELETPRMTSIFARGDYRNPNEPVTAGTPQVLHPFNESIANEGRLDRLALARWLMDRENPLVARVTVNRWWAEIFGQGLVATVEDFGLKGEPATHPELLDWLAVEFMDSGWSMKHMIKTMVLSSTYRQSSAITAEQWAADDQNKWYGRGPRLRMSAETIRDNALAIAGLLSLKQGGPPIRPYQPDGVWTKVGGQNYKYEVSPGDERYRRGVYVVLKRGAPYPSFVNFDASARLACTVNRSRTNTPLQALTLLNDPVYVEAALALAERILREMPEAGDGERLKRAFQLCTAREADSLELAILQRLLEAQRTAAASDPSGKGTAAIGDFKMPADLDAKELAAWYSVATTLLNLDETITKE